MTISQLPLLHIVVFVRIGLNNISGLDGSGGGSDFAREKEARRYLEPIFCAGISLSDGTLEASWWLLSLSCNMIV